MTQPTVGVIGTGRIGDPLAFNLLKAGYSVSVFDSRDEALANLVDAGAQKLDNPGAVAQACDIVLMSLPHVEAVQVVLLGEMGICSQPLNGTIIIDTSTISPTSAQHFAERIEQRGGKFLDAPVTGGEHGAKAGTLSIMIGGPEDAFRAAQPVLNVIGETITYMGASGTGQGAKMVNQLIMMGYFVAIAEGFSFAETLGLDIEQLFAAIEHGGARSGLLSGFGSAYIAQHAEPNGSPTDLPPADHYGELFLKDIAYALQEGHKHRVYMPISAVTHEVLKQMLNQPPDLTHFPQRLLDVWRRSS